MKEKEPYKKLDTITLKLKAFHLYTKGEVYNLLVCDEITPANHSKNWDFKNGYH